MLYDLHELNRALLAPTVELARRGAALFSSPHLARLPGAAGVAAAYELLHRLGRRYDKPAFGIDVTEVAGCPVDVVEEIVDERPFCRLLRFRRITDSTATARTIAAQPPLLLVAPLSGHHATLLRDTVRSLLPAADVYVTDWVDARLVPLAAGSFSLADYVAELRRFMARIGSRLHVVAVCQAAVPALAAAALAAADGEPEPASLTLMGGPIDARRSPTRVNQLATSRPLRWFEENVLHTVPASHPGRGRRVYPGFLQHASFVAMNPHRHARAHWEYLRHLVSGNAEKAAGHRRFYDEYNAVLDLAGEYYLDCVRIVFQQHLLPRGAWCIGGQRVAPERIRRTAILTIEGELDDISGLGQTQAALDLCAGVPTERRRHMTVAGAGHYGIFSGHRWRELVAPQIRAFLASASSA